jgi:uncharacterized protein (DUF362 family)
MSKVAIVKCENYELEEVKKAVKILIRNTDFPEVKGKKILLKPNILSDATPDKAITTHPIVLKAIIQILKEKDAGEILVGDSPANQRKGFKPTGCGLYQICEQENVEWVDFTVKPVKKNLDIVNQTIYMANIIDKVDMVFSLSKFKTHTLMYTTGSIKNIFGLVPNLRKSQQHVLHPTKNSFAKMICGLFKESKVTYTIMDAIVGMEGAGPGNGDPIKVNKLLGSSDALAVDIAQATMMGYNPMDIPIIKCGLDNKITAISLIEEIEYPLYSASSLIMKDYNRIGGQISNNIEDNEYLQRPTPIFVVDKCIKCRKCIDICPAKALVLTDRIIIDTDKCIRCYCCHEVCPVDAIEVNE